MASIPLPALDVRPPQQPDIAGNVQRLLALKSMLGQQQMQQQDIALKQQQVQDQKTVMGYIQQNPGSTFADAASALKGKISLPAYTNLIDTDSTIRQKHAQATQSELDNFQKVHDQQQKVYSNVAGLSDEDLAKQWPSIAQQFNSIPGNTVKVDPNQPLTSQQLQQHGVALGLQEAYLKQEADKRKEAAETTEATQRGEEAAQGAAAKKQEALWYKLHPEAGAPGVSTETASAADWLAKPENKGKTLSDYNIAMKKIVPAYNFQLQAGGVPLGGAPAASAAGKTGNDVAAAIPANIKPTVMAILEGRQTAPAGFALKSPYWQNVMNNVYALDPQWSEQRAQLRKSYTQDKEIGAINTALGHVGALNDAIDGLNNKDTKVLNAIGNRLGIEFGTKTGDAAAMFNTIVHRVGPEIAKAYIGAGGSAGERGADEKDFSPDLAPSILKGNAAITADLLRSKISSKAFQWDQNKSASMPSFEERFIMPAAKQTLDKLAPEKGGGGGAHVAGGAAQGLQEGATGTGSDGKKYVVKGGKWVPQ